MKWTIQDGGEKRPRAPVDAVYPANGFPGHLTVPQQQEVDIESS